MSEEILRNVKALMLRLADHQLEDHLVEIVDVLTAPKSASDAYLTEQWMPQAEALIADAETLPDPVDWRTYRESLEDE